MITLIVALAVQPPGEDYVVLPQSPLSEGDLPLFIAFIIILAVVFGFDILRTWWATNRWRRDARRKGPFGTPKTNKLRCWRLRPRPMPHKRRFRQPKMP